MTQTELTLTASLTGKWKRYPDYKDSGVEWLGRIPAHWQIKPLKQITYFMNGAPFKPSDWGEDGTPIIRIENLNGGENFNRTTLKIDAKYFVGKGDLLFGWSGNRGTSFGPFIWNHEGNYYLNQHIFRLVDFNEEPNWLYWLLKGVTKYIESQAHGIIGLVHITKQDLGSIQAPIIPEAEQKAIAAFLDHEVDQINVLISKKERLIELLQEKRAALISHAVTKGLDPTVPMKDSGVEWLGEIPEHWEVKRLKYMSQNGFVNGLFKKKDQFGTGTKLINVVDLYRGNFLIDFESLGRVETEHEEYVNFKVLSGDIFFVRSSLKLEGVGSSASIAEIPEPTVFECHIVRMRPASKFMVSKYLINYLNSSLVRQRLVALAETTTMTTISQPKLASLEVIVPPIIEQNDLLTYLDREATKIDALVSRIQEGVEKLKEYSTALISAAVTGKIDVRYENALVDGQNL